MRQVSTRHTMREIIASWTPEKKKSDGSMTTLVYRPLSFPASWLFLRLGLSPNAVTYGSAILCLASFAFALVPAPVFQWLAIAGFLLFAVLDCADGNMARTLKSKSAYGGWVDAIGGYFAYATELLSIGVSCFYLCGTSFAIPLYGAVEIHGPWGASIWILIAALAALANVLMRLFHQAFKNAELLAGKTVAPGKEKRMSEEIGITGYLPIIYALGYGLGLLPLALIAYAIVYVGGFAITTLKLMRKAS